MNARDIFLLEVKVFFATFITNFASFAVVVSIENMSLKRYDYEISVFSLKIKSLLGVKTHKQINKNRLVAAGHLQWTLHYRRMSTRPFNLVILQHSLRSTPSKCVPRRDKTRGESAKSSDCYNYYTLNPTFNDLFYSFNLFILVKYPWVFEWKTFRHSHKYFLYFSGTNFQCDFTFEYFKFHELRNANVNASHYNYILWLYNCSMYNYICNLGFVLQSHPQNGYHSKLTSFKNIYFKKLIFGIIKKQVIDYHTFY